MASSQISPYSGTLKTLLLDLAEKAVDNAEEVRRETTNLLCVTVPEEANAESTHRLYDIDKAYHNKLIVTLFVARMCRNARYQQPHRLQRLLDRLEACAETAQDMVKAYRADATKHAVKDFDLFVAKMRQVRLAADMLRISHASISALGDLHQTPATLDAQVPKTFGLKDGQSVQMSPEDYYMPVDRTRFRYEWKMDAMRLHSEGCLTQVEMDRVVIEKREVEFEGIATPKKPIREVPYAYQYKKLNSINALWLSPMTDACFNKSSRADYAKLLEAVQGAEAAGQDPEFSKERAYNPAELARGLATLQIDLGLVMHDDESVIIWPLGQRRESKGRAVIIACRRGACCDQEWVYKAIRLLGKADPWLQHSSAQNSPLDRADPTSTSFPFLRLPAELRNEVYDYYLHPRGHRDRRVFVLEGRRWQPGMRINVLDSPDLCLASRQLWKEALPLHLTNQIISVDVTGRKWGECRASSSYLAQNVLSVETRCMSRMPSTAWLMTVLLFIRSSIVVIKLQTESPGFALTVECADETRVQEHEVQLRELVQILVDDKETGGFSVRDVAVIADFLSKHR
ncbi:hypothetical protein LTR36_005867 [Oleoguttula mirabilis]|uniref:Uncharacterized protein n=1 Tax=Oleoguttula mirabilis TaxID=1507867 RepID=A0AAV9JD87_9PEZI|nr:hypothetical protein LTR36_005867 [Oleoguttula mirabilis]